MNNKSKQTKAKMNNKKSSNKNKTRSDFKSVSAPIAKTKIVSITKPVFQSRGTDGRVTIRHHEFIQDVNGSIDFSLTPIAINPGLPISFPWLNVISVGYESYKFESLKFEFNTSKSATSNGSVMMAVDFDPADAAPSNKSQLLTYNNAVRGPVWNNCVYNCSKSDLTKMNQKFIRYGNLPAGSDTLLYDVGNLFLATTGMADTSVIGELHVSYVVTFFTPQFDLTAYSLATSAKLISTDAPTSINWLGNGIVATGGVPCELNAAKQLRILVPGQYLFTYICAGTGLAGGNPVLTSVGNTITSIGSITVSSLMTANFVATINNSNPITISGMPTGTLTGVSSLRISYYASQLA